MNETIITFGFIVFDIITGFTKALYTNSVDSQKMREGLFHKLAECLAIFGSYLFEYACGYINFGVDIPLINCVCVYICIMELVSCLENLSEVNPQLLALFKPYLIKLKEKGDEDGIQDENK